GLSFVLEPGIYFMAVSPIVPLSASQIYYVGASDGTNPVGSAGPRGILQEEHFIVNGIADDHMNAYVATRASMGVTGVIVPEPAPLIAVVSCALVVVWLP